MRSRLIAAPVAAVALTLTVGGFQAAAAGSSASGGAGQSGKAAASGACLAGATTLVGDLDGDGRPDKVVNIVKPSGIDDPNKARVAQYRPGPLKRTNLGSARARHSDIGDHGEAKQLRVANYNGDAYQDIAILNNSGDGSLDRQVRLSKRSSGPGGYVYEQQTRYGQVGTPAEPPSMPTKGWKHFYKACS